mmetsp:Transcript_34834/g.76617  ORF Transcript_34834/g.76617 Transcript_34834/m.76617 type:complete len:84 (+) Transcript_34834:1676-1927(+)
MHVRTRESAHVHGVCMQTLADACVETRPSGRKQIEFGMHNKACTRAHEAHAQLHMHDEYALRRRTQFARHPCSRTSIRAGRLT